ncbi:MAG: MFS transporter, partial [Chloroflexota bacterium]|nr:MFS transporter [Chloroflexota bacterium]
MIQQNVTPQVADKGVLWNKDFALNLLVAHLLLAGFFSLFIVVPEFIVELGGQAWEIGVIVATFGLAGVIVRPLSGKWILKSGPKRVVLLGISLFVGSTILYIPLPSEWWIVPVRMIQGVGLAIAPVATSTIVANLAPNARRGEGMSYMGNGISIAQLYAPPLGVFLYVKYGFEVAFTVAAALAFMAFLIALFISDPKTRMPEPAAGEKTEYADVAPLISRAAIFPTFVFLAYAFTMAPVSTFLPFLAEEKGLPEDFNPGFYFTVLSGMTMLTTLISGRISDRFGRGSVIVPGLAMVSVAMFLLSQSFVVLMFMGAAFVHGVGYGLIYPGINSLVVDRVPVNERGSALATLQQAWDVGASGGNFVLGPVTGLFGFASAF